MRERGAKRIVFFNKKNGEDGEDGKGISYLKRFSYFLAFYR